MDKTSILKEAQKYLLKGQIDKAIDEGEKLTNSYPDGATFNFLGDLYLKKGDKKLAVDIFHKSATVFRQEGFALKALAIYKKILNINSSDPHAVYALGELNEDKGILTDAIKYYLAAADIFSKENQKNELLKVYDRILQLAPTNIPLRVKVSDMFSKEGFVTEAAKEYIQIGHLYAKENEPEKAEGYYRKASEIQPNDPEAMLALSQLFQDAGDTEQALAHVRLAADKTGESAELLLKSAQILLGAGSTGEAREHLEKAVQKEPSNLEARKLLAEVCQREGDTQGAWQHYSAVTESMISSGDFDQARDILETFKDVEPVESRKRLVSLHKQAGRPEQAFEELSALSGIYEDEGLEQEALGCLKEALEIKPDNAELKDRIQAIEGPPVSPASEEPAIAEEAGAQAGEEDILVGEEKTVEETLNEVDMQIRYGLLSEAVRRLEALKVKEPGNIDVHLKLKSLYLESGDKEQAVTECIVLSELYGRAGDEQSRKAHLQEAFGINPNDPRLAGRVEEVQESEEAPALGTTVEVPPSLEDYSEDFSEAEFYYKQGFFEEAKGIYGRLLKLFPGNEDLQSKFREVEQSIAEPARVEEPQFQETEEEIQITQQETIETEPQSAEGGETVPQETEPALSEAEVGDVQEIKEPALEDDVLEIFEEFKKGLEKEIEAEDTETIYNLGIAYKEMGLIDDAINSFQSAKKDPKYFVQSSSLLGSCFMQKGLYSLAINAFSSALMKTEPQEEASWGLKYELAEAYEKNKSTKEALQLYTEVYGWNSKFREVSEKISQLKKSVNVEGAQKEKKNRVSYI
jgi:tetratricopeptide (TPR) repeat protein